MTVRFLQISDTHCGPNADFEVAPGIFPELRTERLLSRIESWIEQEALEVDFVVHSGDLVHRGHIAGDDGESTRRVLARLRRLPRPVHCVVGNHDHRAAMRSFLGQEPGEKFPSPSDRWAYHFVVGGERFVILDARAELEIDPRGRLCDEQLEFVSNCLSWSEEPVTVFLHYPPLPLDSRWIDETMLLLNGEELHQRLQERASRVRGVFFGHVHRATATVRDGVFYVSCGSATMHFPNWPASPSAVMYGDRLAWANYVRIDSGGVQVKAQWVETYGDQEGIGFA